MGFDLGSVVGSAISAGSSLIGGAMSATNSRKIAKMQLEAQREFAQKRHTVAS